LNLADVACPEPKREEDRSLAATGFDLGQENVAQSYSLSDHVDIDTLLPLILALQFVHFRLVRIRSDQEILSSVLSDGFFKDQKLLKRNDSSLNKKHQNYSKFKI
jgi:hypothetical protein